MLFLRLNCPRRFRLKELMKKVIKDEYSKEELIVHLEYAARSCENIYIVENRYSRVRYIRPTVALKFD